MNDRNLVETEINMTPEQENLIGLYILMAAVALIVSFGVTMFLAAAFG